MENAKTAWNQMEEAEQIDLIKKMLWTAKKRLEGRGALTVAAVIQTPDDVDALTGAAWLRLVDALGALDEDSTDGLGLVAFRAAAAAMMEEFRETRQHPAASLDDPDIRQRPSLGASPEKTVIDRESVAAVVGATRDAIDRAALEHVFQGLTQEEVGRELKMTKQAVNYRLTKIREKALAALA